jgi:hypothetical protein
MSTPRHPISLKATNSGPAKQTLSVSPASYFISISLFLLSYAFDRKGWTIIDETPSPTMRWRCAAYNAFLSIFIVHLCHNPANSPSFLAVLGATTRYPSSLCQSTCADPTARYRPAFSSSSSPGLTYRLPWGYP